ncbi:hypothetical protein MTBSS4_110011 [Magnetospirillum sp. SS-4]|nr:hypothetical protein MTBSS4_110011 [Magnetospirillum sp. SS-4]
MSAVLLDAQIGGMYDAQRAKATAAYI